MLFGGRTDEVEARRIVEAAAADGVNFIDTADTYTGGRSEEIVGRVIAADRDHWVLATKLANPNGADADKQEPNRRGLSRKWIIQELRASLARLGTDYVDILYLHKEDPDTPLAETVRALADLQRAGAIRYFGVSNHKAWRVAAICGLCDELGIDRPVVCQPLYHALNRAAEVELLPACAAFGLGVVPYSPLARGVLTGKYVEAAPPADSRAASGDKRMLETEFRREAVEAARALAEHARAEGHDPGAWALAFVLANKAVTGLIAGPRTLAQWQVYRDALAIDWTTSDEAAVDAVVPPGATAVPHFVDPAYPVEGRVFTGR
jgi:aryl-alcohol dehydrogenase-like predicted oxidoreductase